MQASDWIAEAMVEQGVDTVYEVVGGMIANFIDALHRDGRVRIVSCHHEQAAGFSAEAHARMTGVPGVAMGTSGPGAINLLTALGSCHFDSVPAVFITGQVNRAEQKGERPIRQLGFQETDIAAMAEPIAKAAWRVRTAEELPERIHAAFRLARTGRPGPVLVDIPMDLQRVDISAPVAPASEVVTPEALDPTSAVRLLDDLAGASRPLILAGGGIRTSGAVARLRELVDALGIPVVSSLMGVDALPFAHPLHVGMIGTYGNRWANIALARADLLLVLGSRLDIRQTGADTDSFVSGMAIHHVDCDPGELNNRVPGCLTTVAQLAPFIDALCEGGGLASVANVRRLARRDIRAAEQLAGHRRAARRAGDQPERPDASHLTPFHVGRRICRRCRTAPDVGRSIAGDRTRSAISDLGWDGCDGLGAAACRGRLHSRWRPGRARRRGRRLSAEHPGVANRRAQPAAVEDGHSQQSLSWHGPPVSGVLFRRPLPVDLLGVLGPGLRRRRGRVRDRGRAGWIDEGDLDSASRRCGATPR